MNCVLLLGRFHTLLSTTHSSYIHNLMVFQWISPAIRCTWRKLLWFRFLFARTKKEILIQYSIVTFPLHIAIVIVKYGRRTANGDSPSAQTLDGAVIVLCHTSSSSNASFAFNLWSFVCPYGRCCCCCCRLPAIFIQIMAQNNNVTACCVLLCVCIGHENRTGKTTEKSVDNVQHCTHQSPPRKPHVNYIFMRSWMGNAFVRPNTPSKYE